MAFLQYRGCGVTHMVKHLSSIRERVLNFLDTCEGAKRRSKRNRDSDQLWHDNLVRDIKLSTPKKPVPPRLPPAASVFAFIDGLIATAKAAVAREEGQGKVMSKATAKALQRAIIAIMVCGSHIPPSRLSALKSAQHPDHLTTTCPNKACLQPDTCPGNRFEVFIEGSESDECFQWQEDEAALKETKDMPLDGSNDHLSAFNINNKDGQGDGSLAARMQSTLPPLQQRRRVRYCVPHHKTTSRGFRAIAYTLPLGELTDLMLLFIDRGSQLLTRSLTSLFASDNGEPFNDGTFLTYFRVHVLEGAPFAPFAPSKGRTIFVTAYTGPNGAPESMHEGAAVVRTLSIS